MENYNNGNEGPSGRSSENENSQPQSGRGNEQQSTGNQSWDSAFSKDGQESTGGNADNNDLESEDNPADAPESGTR